MKKYPMKRTIAHKQSVQGATLVEVLVSVFLLTFGILGLMAAQLNSVAAVSESENRAIAAQAAENLAEAMQANPDLVIDSTKGVKRNYSKYLTTTLKDVGVIKSCVNDKSAVPTTVGGTAPSASNSKTACDLRGNAITKTELAGIQLEEFQFVLSQMPNTVDLKYVICLDDVAALSKQAANPVDVSKLGCAGSGRPVIKVVWSSVGSAKETSTGIPDKHLQMYYLVLPD